MPLYTIRTKRWESKKGAPLDYRTFKQSLEEEASGTLGEYSNYCCQTVLRVGVYFPVDLNNAGEFLLKNDVLEKSEITFGGKIPSSSREVWAS